MYIWVALVAFSQLLEGSLKFKFVCRYVDNTSKDGFWFVFFCNFTSNQGNGKGKKVSKPHFLGKTWFIYNILKKVHNGFQRRFLNLLESFVIRFLWKCFFRFYSWLAFCKKCQYGRILVLELWVRKISANNIAWFFKFISWLFSMIFWLLM